MPLRNLFQLWQRAFPDEFGSELSSNYNSNEQQNVKNLLLDHESISNNNRNKHHDQVRRQRDQVHQPDQHSSSSTVSLRRSSQLLSFPNSDTAISLFYDKMIPKLIGKENQQKYQQQEQHQRSVFASILSGQSTCVCSQDFSDDDNETTEACTNTIAIASLFHVCHQLPTSTTTIALDHLQDNNINSKTNNNLDLATMMKPKTPIALIITSSTARSHFIFEIMKKFTETTTRIPILNLDNINETSPPLSSSSSLATFFPEIVIGTSNSLLQVMNLMKPSSEKGNKQIPARISTDRASFVWIDRFDMNYSLMLRKRSADDHHGSHQQQIGNSMNSNNNNNSERLVFLLHFLCVQMPSPSTQFVVTTHAPLRHQEDLQFLAKLDNFVFVVSNNKHRRCHDNGEGAVSQDEPTTTMTDISSSSLLILNVTNEHGESNELLLNNFAKELSPLLRREGQQQQSSSSTSLVTGASVVTNFDKNQLTRNELQRYVLGKYDDDGEDDIKTNATSTKMITLEFANDEDRNFAFRKLNGRLYRREFLYCLLNDIEFEEVERTLLIKPHVIAPPPPQHQHQHTSIVLRNIVRSIVDIWPNPASSSTAKKIEQHLLFYEGSNNNNNNNRNTTSTTSSAAKLLLSRNKSFTGFSWWMTPNTRDAYTLQKDGSARDCIETLEDTGECRYHDEVRLILHFDSFTGACDTMKKIAMMPTSPQNSSSSTNSVNNYLEEGFRIEGISRQVTAHLVFHHHFAAAAVSSSQQQQQNEKTISNSTCFAPRPIVEPEIDADLLSLGSEDV